MDIDLLKNPIFADALTEIESLGFHVSESASPGSVKYGIISGRSNQRWWLVPLVNRSVTTNGLAIFQPITTSAKLFKRAALMATLSGQSGLWARQTLFISGGSRLMEIFKNRNLHFSFFTGTDSPHRKAAVQVMDVSGQIKGFVKVSRKPSVKSLLIHEAATLHFLRSLDLKTVHIPRVLFSGESDGVNIFVTDSLKTSQTKTSVVVNKAHLAFLHELASRTAIPDKSDSDTLITELGRRYSLVARRLPLNWKRRLERGIEHAAAYKTAVGSQVLSHGDFTPWNSFFVNGKLYVFDWEYAEQVYPSGYDLIHFVISSQRITNASNPSQAIKQVFKQVAAMMHPVDSQQTMRLLLTYLCGHALRSFYREPDDDDEVVSCASAEEIADILDTATEWKL
ncbi:phosphotransferase [Candidatus Accumulibacter sp. ACC003]|jgi:hypothetical protein|uniref:phosphotransferase n=1 Tax=Candidatus Accumulibacter sp. ACC003 TaxID=2823334 RepID=UPI0025BA154C|nr:phosphotransferase [Candidatus Accumulibacter sp. ACC003]